MDRWEFAKHMKELRTKKKLTQAQVANHLGLQKSQSVANWESGRVKFPEKYVTPFCELVGADRNRFVEQLAKLRKDELLAKFPNKKNSKIA